MNWLKSHSTIEFLGTWELIHNTSFNVIEFDNIKNSAGSNRFIISTSEWIKKTNATGIISKLGRHGGTYAHRDIAIEFATWISPEFKLYLIKEFQRLKEEETKRLEEGWDVKRLIAKANYKK